MDRMAANLQWLRDRAIVVVYTPFVELDDRNKWHATDGPKNGVRLYRLVHDHFTAKGLDNVIWAFHTTQGARALQEYYPGDPYVDIIGKSAYGRGLVFEEYEWAVEKKKKAGLEEATRTRWVSPYFFAYFHTGRDEHDVAVDWLERAFTNRAGAIFAIKGSFLLAPLRPHPRFQALLRKMNLS